MSRLDTPDDAPEPRGSAAEYRQRAAEMDAAAEAADLEGQKAKFRAAAQRWRQLADLQDNPPRLGAS